MSVLQRLCASGGPEVLIITLELSCPLWAAPICICPGFSDYVCGTEDDRTLVFKGQGIDVALPKKDSSGSQNLTFAIDNLSGEPQRLIDEALEADERVNLVLRKYLSTDLTQPAERPYRLIVRDTQSERTQVQITAGLFDLTEYAWPRDLYDTQFAPDLKYMQ